MLFAITLLALVNIFILDVRQGFEYASVLIMSLCRFWTGSREKDRLLTSMFTKTWHVYKHLIFEAKHARHSILVVCYCFRAGTWIV